MFDLLVLKNGTLFTKPFSVVASKYSLSDMEKQYLGIETVLHVQTKPNEDAMVYSPNGI